MFILSGIITGVISGIVASGIFFLVLLCFRPKVKISDEICRGDGYYLIKVVNHTKSMLKNLNYTLHIYETLGDGIFRLEHIKPRKRALFCIDKYDKSDMDANYAVCFSYEIPEEFLLNTGNKLVFNFLADHALSNTSACIKKEYTYDDIIEGVFETRTSTKIIRNRIKNAYDTPNLKESVAST